MQNSCTNFLLIVLVIGVALYWLYNNSSCNNEGFYQTPQCPNGCPETNPCDLFGPGNKPCCLGTSGCYGFINQNGQYECNDGSSPSPNPNSSLSIC